MLAENDIDQSSDYWYAQLALVCTDSPQAIEKAKGIQILKQEFEIRDTLEEGCRAIQQLVELLPEMWLYFCYDRTTGRYTLVKDLSKTHSELLDPRTPNCNKFMVGYYYLFKASACDMEAIRKGMHVLVDCKNVGWHNKRACTVSKEMFDLVMAKYPFGMTVKHYSTGVIFNLFYSMLKKVLPDQSKLHFQNGFTSYCALRDVFLVPTTKAANERLVASLQQALKERYEHENMFSLHTEENGSRE